MPRQRVLYCTTVTARGRVPLAGLLCALDLRSRRNDRSPVNPLVAFWQALNGPSNRALSGGAPSRELSQSTLPGKGCDFNARACTQSIRPNGFERVDVRGAECGQQRREEGNAE